MSYRKDPKWKPSYGASRDYYAEQQYYPYNAAHGASSSSSAAYTGRGDDQYHTHTYRNHSVDFRNRDVDRTGDSSYRDRARGEHSFASRDPRAYDRDKQPNGPRSDDAAAPSRAAAPLVSRMSPRPSDSGSSGRRESGGALNDGGWTQRGGGSGAGPSRPRRSASPPSRPATTRETCNETNDARNGSGDRAAWWEPRDKFRESNRARDHSILPYGDDLGYGARPGSAARTPGIEEGEIATAGQRDSPHAAAGGPSGQNSAVSRDPRRRTTGDTNRPGPSTGESSREASVARGVPANAMDIDQVRQQTVRAELELSERPRQVTGKLQDAVKGGAIATPRRPDMRHLIGQFLEAVDRQRECHANVNFAEFKLQESLDWVEANASKPALTKEFYGGPKGTLESRIREAKEAKENAGREVSEKMERIYEVLMTFTEDSSLAASAAVQRGPAHSAAILVERQDHRIGGMGRSDQGTSGAEPDDAGQSERTAPGTPPLLRDPVAPRPEQQASNSRLDRKFELLDDRLEEIREFCHATEANMEELVAQTVQSALQDIARRRREKGKQRIDAAPPEADPAVAANTLPLVPRTAPRSQSAGVDDSSGIESRLSLLRSEFQTSLHNELNTFHEQLRSSFSQVQQHFDKHKAARQGDKMDSTARDEAQQGEIEQLKVQAQHAFEERRWLKSELDATKNSLREVQSVLVNFLQQTQASRVTAPAVLSRPQITQISQSPTAQPSVLRPNLAASPPAPGPQRAPQAVQGTPSSGRSAPTSTNLVVANSQDSADPIERFILATCQVIISGIPSNYTPEQTVGHVRAAAEYHAQMVHKDIPTPQHDQMKRLALQIANKAFAMLAARATSNVVDLPGMQRIQGIGSASPSVHQSETLQHHPHHQQPMRPETVAPSTAASPLLPTVANASSVSAPSGEQSGQLDANPVQNAQQPNRKTNGGNLSSGPIEVEDSEVDELDSGARQEEDGADREAGEIVTETEGGATG
ncbi:hypothetical protein BCV69DRAFT_280974 [Microstroma glucosiphilum]|uniref:Uncharacterized protein n=1 Tax=Pseudomicrostroma glucosiphilum TaxID=1684307 RepID=A0A316UDW3_9BASI|nr:hypothetical protein BCV69DRAFT_280974 [Pseudomicrostroma glucosiphilum]PWN23362.1 hypothetical protein BCV69DRAFT_280974 [Pseudomicrostroma glucosiphilum]